MINLICAKVNKYTGEKFPNKKEIANFANRLLNDYCKKFNRTLETIDHDEFIPKYIGIDVQYQRLSLNKSILGLTVQRDGFLETYNSDGSIKVIKTKRGDIFIDADACGCEERELFTIYHELKHYLLDLDKDLKVDKIIDDNIFVDGAFKVKTSYGWAEYFANYFAVCMILSRRLLKKIYNELHNEYLTKHNTNLNGRNIKFLKYFIKLIHEKTLVSQSAIAIRLKDINLITETTFKRLNYNFGKEAAFLYRYKNRGGKKCANKKY